MTRFSLPLWEGLEESRGRSPPRRGESPARTGLLTEYEWEESWELPMEGRERSTIRNRTEQ